ncbi:MAG: sulfatase-like hydrolase/transferase [Rikenellaceae bacterium]
MNIKSLQLLALGGLCVNTINAATTKSRLKEIAKEKPNVVFIYADDMGKGILSAYGQKYIQTPNIDKLIKGGVQFNRAYGAHYSAPARASLLTGYSDCHKGHWQKENGSVMIVADTCEIASIEAELNDRDVRLAKNDEYLCEVFKKAGYYTGQIGKLEYGFATSRQQMKSHGWDYFYGFLDHGRCHGFYPPFLFENERIVMIDGNTRTDCADAGYAYHTEESYRKRLDMSGKEQYSQDLFNDKIADFIDEHKSEPFFLYHPTQLPHGAVSVPYIHEQVKYKPNLTPIEKEYATMVILLDEAVGKILQQLEDLNIDDRTMVIFSVDNGHEIYYNSEGKTSNHTTLDGTPFNNYDVRFTSEIVGDYFNGNMGTSGKKRSNLEGGVRVPLCYYMPGVLEAAACDDVVANYDLIATVAEMLDVKINKKKDASSYFELLENPSAKLPTDRFVYLDSREGPTLIMNDGWKLRYCNVTGKYELYNIDEDLREENDLSAQEPQRVAAMKAILAPKIQATECRGAHRAISKMQ